MEACYPKNMYLKEFNISLCIHVVLNKFPSMDWSLLYRLYSRCDDSTHSYIEAVGKVLYIIFSCFSHQLPKFCIFGILKHVHCNAWQLQDFLEID